MIIVASVSCIYGLGSPDDYRAMVVALKKGDIVDRDEILRKLIDIQYERNDVAFERGRFRVCVVIASNCGHRTKSLQFGSNCGAMK